MPEDHPPDDLLSMEDVRAVVRLLGEVADPARRAAGLDEVRAMLFDELSKLIDAAGWLWFHGRRGPEGRRIMAFSSLSRFADPRQQASTINSTFDDTTRGDFDRAVQPLFSQAVQQPSPRGHFTRLRREIIDDPTWLDSPMLQQHLATAGLDDFLFSIYPLGTHVWSGAYFPRRTDQPKFTSRERAIVHLILNNVDWLHREGSDVAANSDELVELPPRPRQVLVHLIGGDSAKQIARKLDLSVHTVNDHLKTIHRHFNVASRSELLAKFIASAGPPATDDASPAAKPPPPGA